MPHIALIGDHDPAVTAHQAIPRALELAATLLAVRIDWDWIHTDSLSADAATVLAPYAGFWCVPASPYASFEGALGGIRFARESGRPFLGTCGGFQHAIIEHARHVLHIDGASHAEVEPDSREPVIVPLSCGLIEESGTIFPESGSQLARYCGSEPISARYHCRYGLAESHLRRLTGTGMRIGARDSAGEVRAIELEDHPYFLATLFQPERSALEGHAHPLVAALVGAVTAASPPRAAVRSFV